MRNGVSAVLVGRHCLERYLEPRLNFLGRKTDFSTFEKDLILCGIYIQNIDQLRELRIDREQKKKKSCLEISIAYYLLRRKQCQERMLEWLRLTCRAETLLDVRKLP